VSLGALAIGVVIIFLGGWRIGVTWDEPLHVQRFNNYVDTGWYLGDGQLEHDRPAPQMTQQYVYAPATMLMLHGLGVVAGVDQPDEASNTAAAYAVRHVGVGLISLLGIAAICATARLLFGRWDWAVVSAALLATLPIWTGHSMFNVKDVPVGTGYSLLTLGLCIVARRAQGADWRRRLSGPAAVAGGTFLAVGTRPGMWVGLAASVLSMAACWLLGPGEGPTPRRFRDDLWRYRDVTLGLVVAGLGLWAIYPRVFGSPIHALWRAAFSSANFLGAHSSSLFVPLRVTFEMPALVLGFVAVGIFVAARQLIRVRLRPGVVESRLVVVMVQMAFLPLVAIVHGASLYGDLRQLLFAAPATVLLATLGMRHLVTLAGSRTDQRSAPIVVTVACATVLVPLVDQATLFPYDYAYYNPLASAIRLPTDGEYYRGSARELVPELPTDGRIVCSPEGDKDGNALRMGHLDGWVDCRTAQVSPIAAFDNGRETDEPGLAPDQFWAINFNSRGAVAHNCERVTGISRRLGFRRLPMATLSLCTREFPVLSGRVVDFEKGSDQGLSVLDLGWFYPGTDQSNVGIRSRGGPSTMTFRLDPSFASHDVALIVETTTSAIPTVSFGGAAVTVTRSADPRGLRIQLPRMLVDRAVQEAQTLAFRSPDADRLDLKVVSLTAEPADRASAP
jgi:hypothetical protein